MRAYWLTLLPVSPLSVKITLVLGLGFVKREVCVQVARRQGGAWNFSMSSHTTRRRGTQAGAS